MRRALPPESLATSGGGGGGGWRAEQQCASMAEAQRQLEAFRVRQYGGPHPAVAAQQQQQQQAEGVEVAAAPGGVAPPAAAQRAAPPSEHIEPDTGRCVLHFDIDCFYAQVEEVRRVSRRVSRGWMRRH